jgi:hypothetical protein
VFVKDWRKLGKWWMRGIREERKEEGKRDKGEERRRRRERETVMTHGREIKKEFTRFQLNNFNGSQFPSVDITGLEERKRERAFISQLSVGGNILEFREDWPLSDCV